MKDIDICYGFYAAKWSLTDFYEGSEQKLKDALASGEDFDTGWWGCSKEIRYARIVREDGNITIEVSCGMDDLFEEPDLIYDALWEECHSEEELPKEIIDSIREAAIEDGIDDNTILSGQLSANASLEKIKETIHRLENQAEIENEANYKRLREIVADHVAYMKGGQTSGT